jgi:ribose transport system substrate-binding protein
MKSRTLLCAAAALLALGTAAQAGELTSAKPLKVGMSVGSLSHPYFAASIAGARDEITRLNSSSSLTTVGCDWDLGKQDNQISNFIVSGSNVMLINAADPKAIGPSVQRAKAAGLVVAAFDVTAAGADVAVMTDNTKAGYLSCKELAQQIGHKGDVVIINGPPVSSVLDRVAGCKKALAEDLAINVVSDNQNPGAGRDGGLAAMQTFLTRYSHIDGVFAINDEQAIGADLAAKQLQRSEVKIAAVDGSPAGLAAMRSGDSRIVATAAQDPYEMAAEAIDLAAEILNGGNPANRTVLLEPKLITAKNIDGVEGWPAHR